MGAGVGGAQKGATRVDGIGGDSPECVIHAGDLNRAAVDHKISFGIGTRECQGAGACLCEGECPLDCSTESAGCIRDSNRQGRRTHRICDDGITTAGQRGEEGTVAAQIEGGGVGRRRTKGDGVAIGEGVGIAELQGRCAGSVVVRPIRRADQGAPCIAIGSIEQYGSVI